MMTGLKKKWQLKTKRMRGGLNLSIFSTYPEPPVLGGAPVSPWLMARAVVLKAARMGRKTAVLVRVVRSILMLL